MSFPKLVSDVIAKARGAYPDCSTTKALDYFNTAWRLLADTSDIRYKTQSITLTAGTREYNLPDDVIDVSSVYYQRTSDPTTWIQLYQKTVDELDIIRKGWRTSVVQQAPYEFYIGTSVGSPAQLAQAVIGLVQLPDTSSSAGYPCLAIYGQAITDLLSTDTIPAMANTDQYFVASIKRQYAEENDFQMIGTWMKLETSYLDQLTRHLKQMGAHVGTRLIAGWTQRMSSSR